MKCPKCGGKMIQGYSGASSPLSWIEDFQFNSIMFIDRDLAESGFKSVLPSKAKYFVAHNCSMCQIVTVDYSQKLDRKTVQTMRVG